jgi:signal transduction histidine kinase
MKPKKKKSRQSFFKHLLWSHMTIVAIGGFSLFIGLVAIFIQNRNITVLSRNLIPVTQATASVLHGVQQSLASLRGWVSLNESEFIKEWYSVWEDEIDPAVIQLEQVGAQIDLPKFSQRMTELSNLLTELKESQWWVLEIAQTLGNEPARVKYVFEIQPVLSAVHEMIFNVFHTSETTSHIIDKEQIHNIVIFFYEIRDMLEKIIFHGEIGLEEQYRYHLQMLRHNVSELPKTFPGNEAFDEFVAFYKREIKTLEIVSMEAIAMRKSNNWNVIRHLMETETVPLARRVVRVMDTITRDVDYMMKKQTTVTARTGLLATWGMSGLLFVMLFTAYIISRNRAKALSEPVITLALAARQLAAGTLLEDIFPQDDDELGDLTQSFNTMRQDLQLTQNRLVRQERLAAIGKLSGSVAHDIRNPLGAISNSVYFLNLICNKEKVTDDKVKKHLSLMEDEIDRVNEIINDLLDFSRENAPQLSRGDLNNTLEQVLSGFDFSGKITIELNLDSGLPPIAFDPSQMQRVFHNLINNAGQAMPDGGNLHVQTGHDESVVWVRINDNGDGIAMENLNTIFEPLFTTKAKGVGLGLSIVKDFINKHHGSIKVESIEKRGSTFTLHLPRHETLKEEE